VAAHEIMIGTPAIRNLIREAKVAQMYSAIQTGQGMGMQTLDQNLTDLVRRNAISSAEARGKAKIPKISLAEHGPHAPLLRMLCCPPGPRPPWGGPAAAGAAVDAQSSTTLARSPMERDQASKFINDLLKLMVSARAATCSSRPTFRPPSRWTARSPRCRRSPHAGAHAGAGARHHERQAGRRVRAHQGVQLRHLAGRHRALPRQRLHAAGQRGHGAADHPAELPTIDGLGLPRCSRTWP
jgi:hypothetical protein